MVSREIYGMARQRKGPWRRGQNGHWYTTIGRKLVKVADKTTSYADAFQAYVELVAHPQQAPPGRMTIGVLCNSYLEWCQGNRAEKTYGWYRGFCKSFVESAGVNLRVADLRPYHLQQWLLRAFPNATDNSKHGAIRAICRVLNWATNNGMIDRNPILGIEKPTRTSREFTITAEQFKELLGHVTDQEFRDYLSFMWETGCRPQEIRVIEPRHRDGDKLVLERINSKGQRYNRVIYLNEASVEILDRAGGKFQNSHGRPWTANSVRCRFRRLKKKMGMPELCANTMRHSWATNTLKGGMDTTTASILMGHRDPATLIRNYQHLAQDDSYLAQAAQAAMTGVAT